VEKFNRWNAEHSVHIPFTDHYFADVNVRVWDRSFDGRIRMDVDTTSLLEDRQQHATACMSPEQARRLAELLLAATEWASA
jgi:hypothetical protein